MAIRQLLYISLAPRGMHEEDLKDLLGEARRLNLEHDITGLLIYVDRLFMQCIEGRPEGIGQLADNIRNDERNIDFTVLLDHQVEELAFPRWSMGFRTYSLTDLKKEEGFNDLQNVRDLEAIEQNSQTILMLMKNFYVANARRGG